MVGKDLDTLLPLFIIRFISCLLIFVQEANFDAYTQIYLIIHRKSVKKYYLCKRLMVSICCVEILSPPDAIRTERGFSANQSQILSCNGTRRTTGHVHPEVRTFIFELSNFVAYLLLIAVKTVSKILIFKYLYSSSYILHRKVRRYFVSPNER